MGSLQKAGIQPTWEAVQKAKILSVWIRNWSSRESGKVSNLSSFSGSPYVVSCSVSVFRGSSSFYKPLDNGFCGLPFGKQGEVIKISTFGCISAKNSNTQCKPAWHLFSYIHFPTTSRVLSARCRRSEGGKGWSGSHHVFLCLLHGGQWKKIVLMEIMTKWILFQT